MAIFTSDFKNFQQCYKLTLKIVKAVLDDTLKNTFFSLISTSTEMSESNSNYKFINSDDGDSQSLIEIPQAKTISRRDIDQEQIRYQSSEQHIRLQSQGYIKISNQSKQIDEEAIFQEINKKLQQDPHFPKQTQKVSKKKKIEKTQKTTKTNIFGSIKHRWKAQMDQYVEQYKNYLLEQKKNYNSKQKEFLLDFFKILLEGIFELREYALSEPNDLTMNQKKIINPKLIVFEFLRGIVQKFDIQFKSAKIKDQIKNTKDKWDPLVKNCRDQTNFELRRKILRGKIKPSDVIQKSNEFLMSEQLKMQKQRQEKLLLAEDDKKFENFADEEEEQNRSNSSKCQNNQCPLPIQNIQSISPIGILEKRISPQREKIQQYNWFLCEDLVSRLKKRIQDDLKGTSSFDHIMTDFTKKFEAQ